MHYYIDGYNLLFRLLQEKEDLQTVREQIIRDLNKIISQLRLNVTIVFDAQFQEGVSTQGHFNSLEILFTGFGETADAYIIQAIQHAPFPQKETVVTSDKELAYLVRNLSARVESVENFMYRIQRAYKNRTFLSKGANKKNSFIKNSSPSVASLPVHQRDVSVDACMNHYATIFEAKWERIREQEELHKIKKEEDRVRAFPKKCPPRQRKRQLNPFKEPVVLGEEEGLSDQERWLRAFEKGFDR